jgi:hypothetical protein
MSVCLNTRRHGSSSRAGLESILCVAANAAIAGKRVSPHGGDTPAARAATGRISRLGARSIITCRVGRRCYCFSGRNPIAVKPAAATLPASFHAPSGSDQSPGPRPRAAEPAATNMGAFSDQRSARPPREDADGTRPRRHFFFGLLWNTTAAIAPKTLVHLPHVQLGSAWQSNNSEASRLSSR